MLSTTTANLRKLVGQVCSIVCVASNRIFDEVTAREHYVVRIVDINQDGVWGHHPYNNELFSFFAMEQIVSIHQEVELNPNNPEHLRMIEEYEQRTGTKLKSDLRGAPDTKEEPSQEDQEGGIFVDIESLEKLAAQTKKTFDMYDLTK